MLIPCKLSLVSSWLQLVIQILSSSNLAVKILLVLHVNLFLPIDLRIDETPFLGLPHTWALKHGSKHRYPWERHGHKPQRIKLTPYIIGGHDAHQGDFPYIVSLQKKRRYQHFCGGSIIAPRIILTAAHCVHGAPLDKILIMPNYDNRVDSDVKRYHIESVVIHDKYKITLNDIALIKLTEPIPLGKEFQKIRLASGKEERDRLTVAGWGQTENGFSRTLQRVDVLWHQDSTCKSQYYGNYFSGMLCAGGDNADSCIGDSGGPLIRKGLQPQNDILIGITSWGAVPCGNKAGVYTDISYYLDWIINSAGLDLSDVVMKNDQDHVYDNYNEHHGQLVFKLDDY